MQAQTPKQDGPSAAARKYWVGPAQSCRLRAVPGEQRGSTGAPLETPPDICPYTPAPAQILPRGDEKIIAKNGIGCRILWSSKDGYTLYFNMPDRTLSSTPLVDRRGLCDIDETRHLGWFKSEIAGEAKQRSDIADFLAAHGNAMGIEGY
jgi:hypothetical protein